MRRAKAVIADDEQPLRRFLRERLSELWPELEICGEAEHGQAALDLIAAHGPDVIFLDIRMPGLNGMETAERIGRSCRIVFVTAYDEYAVEAFEKEAVDYLLKPVSPERLRKTILRIQEDLSMGTESAESQAEKLMRLVRGVSSGEAPRYLEYLRVSHGDGVRLIPVDQVIYFKALDKYTALITHEGESLIRKPVKELAAELDPDRFWRVHRGAVVNVRFIDRVSRSLTGKGVLKLKGCKDTLPVSNRYMHLFKRM
jgi:DNA-binding LytR/AlgR family response regulator